MNNNNNNFQGVNNKYKIRKKKVIITQITIVTIILWDSINRTPLCTKVIIIRIFSNLKKMRTFMFLYNNNIEKFRLNE